MPTQQPAPTPPPSAAERAYEHVKARILDCELPGGRFVSEGEIATALDVSRTPVREAFLRLQAEGWMRLYPKRGALIVPAPADEMETVLEARQLFEAHAARRICADAAVAAGVGQRMHECADAQAAAWAAGDRHGFAVLDAQFHRIVVEAGGNGLLTGFYATIRDRQHRMTASSVGRRHAVAEDVVRQHHELAALIVARDADGFAAALAAHLTAIHR
ncbi:GntR family transcriptional regulator [Pseudonocardia acidicola]|uniref:GntR family transcriptional regulator n=1 Tax=Pseudonocardia acidicola TaxID=2724939 RepID=A0ABX1S7L1_9PSEU|nr:GntR family transcriptional regulator [Pseudonocardia acidicola]NMH97080.1 GntR family transcriptional regulator [Pseudonocardia acidicola]